MLLNPETLLPVEKSMLFVMDDGGEYRPASKNEIFTAAKRLSSSNLRRGKIIKSSVEAGEAVQHKMVGYEHEIFACLFLDSRHRLLEFAEIFKGSISCTTVHPREIVKEALRLNAAAVIFAHNHPSGETAPSPQDIELTQKLRQILHHIDVKVLDHVIIGDDVLSMADSGYFQQFSAL